MSVVEDECWIRCCSVSSAFLIKDGLVHVEESSLFANIVPLMKAELGVLVS